MDSQTCFYICPIGDAESATRKRSNQIFEHVVSTTLVPLGYQMTRADQMDQSGVITSQTIDGPLNSDLVVADLTDHNPNVFYELAVRHAVAKPFIQLIAEGQNLPFDIQGLRTILIDHRDLDSVANAKITLEGMIASIREGKPVETPLTYTLNLQTLAQSGNSEARGIADIITEIQGLKQIIRSQTPHGVAASLGRNDFSILREFVEYLARSRQVTADDFRRIMDNKKASIPLQVWAKAEMLKHYPDEPPF